MSTITPQQMSAALSLLDMTQADLSKMSHVSLPAVSRIVSGKGEREPKMSTRQKVIDTLLILGVEFLNGGVRINPGTIELIGIDGFKTFMDDVYRTMSIHGGEMCLYNTEPDLWTKHLGREWYAMHNKRMSELEGITVRNAIREGNYNYILDCCTYRWIPESKWKDINFYAYGPKLGILDFSDESIKITVMQQQRLAESYRVLFDSAWEHDTIPAEGAKP